MRRRTARWLRRMRARLRLSVRRSWWNEQALFYLLAVSLGAAAAYGAIGFRSLISLVQWTGFGTPAEKLLDHLGTIPGWQIVLVPTMGGLIVGLFVYWAMPDRRPLGVADVIEAAELRGGRMPVISGLKAALVSIVSIGSGASVGREGPVVHLGATIAAAVAQRMHLGRGKALTLLGCGVAAAVAASFNAPLAGVLFALEVVVGHYAVSALAPIVIAAVVGTVISRAVYGDFPAFIVPEHLTVAPWEFVGFAVLGLASAGAAILFMRTTFTMQSIAETLPVPAWSRPAIAGLIIGAVALAFPQVLGVGYGVTDQAIRGVLHLDLLLALLFVKIFATALCIGFGFGGGVFSPSLVIGAMLGGAFGGALALISPLPASALSVYSMVGMGAVAGAVLGAPISTILIVFELTGDYKVTIAVMVAVVIATIVVQQFGGRSFFTRQLAHRGIDLSGAREREILREIRVRRMMDTEVRTVPAGLKLPDLRRRIVRAPHGALFVVDGERSLLGMITVSDVSEALFEDEVDEVITAAEIATPAKKTIDIGASLDQVTEQFGGGEPFVPVVDDGKLVGVLMERDVILAQQRALLRARAEERGEA